eukprot:TRINITY_DN111436_c0_g1_i1.p1 TRINITY_DN111436_c0_g1~~TRINITY_DN111436_c0_g1_i1.p1  ORF type:complete len:237 (+),score=34.49 TRINITY_DN111436_c0_g1_i1:104-814(+)
MSAGGLRLFDRSAEVAATQSRDHFAASTAVAPSGGRITGKKKAKAAAGIEVSAASFRPGPASGLSRFAGTAAGTGVIGPRRVISENRPTTRDMPLSMIFAYYDRDCDGYLTRDEFWRALQGAGVSPNPTSFERMCQHYSASPNADQFAGAVHELAFQRPRLQDLMDKFGQLTEEAGRIDADVLRYVAANFGEQPLSDLEVEQLILAAQPNKDGLVDLKQLGETLLAVPPWMPTGVS